MNKFKFVLIIFTYLSISAYSECPSDFNERISNTDFKILFIGNSLTYTNNLPELVRHKAKLRGIFIRTKMIAFPNYAIGDHWNDGKVQKQIASKKYDFVIIQQGPSSQPDGKKMLIEYGEKYSALCRNNNVKLSYFMVWSSKTYFNTFKGVINNYREAAKINDAILCPVGEVWKEYFERTNNYDYYGSDGFHPSPKGSQVAADVIVEYLFSEGTMSE